MKDLLFYSVSDLAKRLDIETCKINYIIMKHRIDPDGVIGSRVKVYGEEKLILIKELIEKTRKHRREQDVTRFGR